MTQNVLQIWPEILGIVAGVVVLFIFALALGIKHRPTIQPGSGGHRKAEDESDREEIAPDGYIDSFAKEIEEAGGALPPVVKIALPGVILWWLLYLILYWNAG